MNLPVPAGALLAGLAFPYLICAVRVMTRPGATDRAVRLLRNVPGLGLLALAAAVGWPHLAGTVPVPVELAVGAACYLLTVSVSCWCLPPEPSPARRAAHARLTTLWAVAVLGAGLTAVVATLAAVAGPLARLAVGQ
ncbi:hypothetical protein [Streptomyces sp. NPDC087862]|uniref:hypothetical protein n=1 Tax=Streptomyces sp. NPDC087862 TaxID=3365813 RepID=UPI0037F9F91B